MEASDILALGKELGYEGNELREFVKQERDRERQERDREREDRIRERERQLKEKEAEKEVLELQIRLAEVQRTNHTSGSEGNPVSASVGGMMTSPQRWMAPFDEKKDDLDAYLLRFERLAAGQRWPTDQWGTLLTLCLRGEALAVVSRLSTTESGEFSSVKKALMKRFRLTAEGFRDKFRGAKPESGESGAQYATRLSSLFDRWVELSETTHDYESVRNLLLTEQFVKSCPPKLSLFIRERATKDLASMAELADRFLEAQGSNSLGTERPEKKTDAESPENPEKRTSGGGRPPPRCFLCNRTGHLASACREKGFRSPSCWRCGRTGHTANMCQGRGQEQHLASCCVSSGASEGKSPGPVQDGYVELVSGDRLPVVNLIMAAEKGHLTNGVPVRTGSVGKRSVTVLRDTGCNIVVVRKDLVAEDGFTGNSKAVYLVDGTVRMLPEARLSIRTPFYSGGVTALCMECPLYDVILGNIPGARAAGDPDPSWDSAVDIAGRVKGVDDVDAGTNQAKGTALETKEQRGNAVHARRSTCGQIRVPGTKGEAWSAKKVGEEQGIDRDDRGCLRDLRGPFAQRRRDGRTIVQQQENVFSCVPGRASFIECPLRLKTGKPDARTPG